MKPARRPPRTGQASRPYLLWDSDTFLHVAAAPTPPYPGLSACCCHILHRIMSTGELIPLALRLPG